MSNSTSPVKANKPGDVCPRCPHRLADISTHIQTTKPDVEIDGQASSEKSETDTTESGSSEVVSDTTSSNMESPKSPKLEISEAELSNTGGTFTNYADYKRISVRSQAFEEEPSSAAYTDYEAMCRAWDAVPDPWVEKVEAQAEWQDARLMCPSCLPLATELPTLEATYKSVSESGEPSKTVREEGGANTSAVNDKLQWKLCSDCEEKIGLGVRNAPEYPSGHYQSSSFECEEDKEHEINSSPTSYGEDVELEESHESKSEEFAVREDFIEETMEATTLCDRQNEPKKAPSKLDTLVESDKE